MDTVIKLPLEFNCGLVLKIAHHKQKAGTNPVYFPNQSMRPAYIEPCVYISGNEFECARVIETPDDYSPFALEIKLRKSAASKINNLVKLSNLIGLGVFNDNLPMYLIRTVIGAEPGKIWWTGFDTFEEAKKILELFSNPRNLSP